MNRRQESLRHAQRIIEQLEYRRDAVGRATRRRYDAVFLRGQQAVRVDAVHKSGSVGARCGYHDALALGLGDVPDRQVGLVVLSRALNHVVDAEFAPIQLRNVSRRHESYYFSLNGDCIFGDVSDVKGVFQQTVCCIMPDQVDQVISSGTSVVDGNDLEIVSQ